MNKELIESDEAKDVYSTPFGIITFYKKDDLGADGIWDNWRLEGPSFVWHYRGAPHVHVWVNVADSAKVELNSNNRSGALREG